MNAQQTKALRESIAHWIRMREDPDCGERPSGDDCACCAVFGEDFDAFAEDFDECSGCPIYEFTSKRFCCGTPYYKAMDLFYITDEGFKNAAQAEIDFLNKVLEAG